MRTWAKYLTTGRHHETDRSSVLHQLGGIAFRQAMAGVLNRSDALKCRIEFSVRFLSFVDRSRQCDISRNVDATVLDTPGKHVALNTSY